MIKNLWGNTTLFSISFKQITTIVAFCSLCPKEYCVDGFVSALRVPVPVAIRNPVPIMNPCAIQRNAYHNGITILRDSQGNLIVEWMQQPLNLSQSQISNDSHRIKVNSSEDDELVSKSSISNYSTFNSKPSECRPLLIQSRRRRFIKLVSKICTGYSFGIFVQDRHYANAVASSTALTDKISHLQITPDEAKVTNKVFFKVRISRKDGTFYVRDDDITKKNDPMYDEDNLVYVGMLVFGLFGNNAPNHVKKFLSYVGVPSLSDSPFDDNPYPSYSRSIFSKFDEATGVVKAGYIPSVEITELNGSNALKYGGRLFPADLWLEKGVTTKVTHIGKGLLTHKLLDPTPEFGITTRHDTKILDATSVVFGRILLDDSSNEFLARLSDIPTYSMERPMSANEGIVDEAADIIFNAQREFFRSAAKSIGDTRISKVYEGKFLRRVEVTEVGFL